MPEFVNYDITPYLQLIDEHFPLQININNNQIIKRCIHINATDTELQDSNYKDFIELIDSNIGTYYKKIDGPNWKEDKLEEMKHDKLVYISYYSGEVLIGFLSFVLTFDEYELSKIFYLYEIHILSKFQNAGLGGKLINAFHSLIGPPSDNIMIDKIEIFKLTVFSDNEVAINWYRKLGYELSAESPVDRPLRNGKVIKPDYYIMVKYTSSLMIRR